MKSLKYTFFIFLVTVSTVSCKKEFLEVEDQSVLLRQQYVKDLTTLGHYMNGVYISLAQKYFVGTNQAFPEVVADNIKPKSNGSELRLAYNYAMLAENSDNVTIYLFHYAIVKACNFALEKATEYKVENPSLADNIKAQALSIRALLNFTTVNVYAQSYSYSTNGSHPGIALPVTSDPFEKAPARNTVSEVYEAIIKDLNAAIPLFSTDDISSTLLLNRVAAKALLARVLLFKQDYAVAKNVAVDVISKVPLMNAPDYPAKLFTLNETEAILQLAPSSVAVASGSYNTSFQGRFFQGNQFSIQLFATKSIADILNEDVDDVRKAWVTDDNGNWKITKYPVNVVPGFNPTSQSYFPTLLRSSEMYLIAAEACARLADDDNAKLYLNAIRLRANPMATPVTETGSDLLAAIMAERRKELAFEGLRMFDLQRWKMGVTRGPDVTPGAPTELPYPDNKAIAPIPLVEITISGFQQNPGY